MCRSDTFDIDLGGLQDGDAQVVYDLDDAFFDAVGSGDIRSGRVKVSVRIRKKTAFCELDFHIEGTVGVPCDICLDDVACNIDSDNKIVAVLTGDSRTAVSAGDDVVTVDNAEGTLNVAWLIYEFITLALPVRHVHEEGRCNSEMIDVLHRYMTDGNQDDA